MRIGINALYLIPGGVGGTETYLRRLLRELVALGGGDEYVLYANAENAGTFDAAPNLREVTCSMRATRRSSRIAWEQLVLPALARRHRLDLLHSPGYTAPLVLPCPGVVTIHDMNYHFHPEDWGTMALWVNRALLPRVAQRATRVLTVSHASARAIAEVLGVPANKLDVVHSGVDGNLVASGPEDERRVRARFGLDGRFVLSVTASHPHKNLDGLLGAYDLARRDWPEVPPLVIVGIRGRHQARIEALRAGWRGPGRVVLTGWLDGVELAALYRAASLFVLPSKYEGFGFPVLEAMSVGVPVVSSNAASLPEIVGDAGLLVDPEDTAALATAMRRASDDGTLRADLVARGRAQAARFTWAAAARGTLQTYRAATRGA